VPPGRGQSTTNIPETDVLLLLATAAGSRARTGLRRPASGRRAAPVLRPEAAGAANRSATGIGQTRTHVMRGARSRFTVHGQRDIRRKWDGDPT